MSVKGWKNSFISKNILIIVEGPNQSPILLLYCLPSFQMFRMENVEILDD